MNRARNDCTGQDELAPGKGKRRLYIHEVTDQMETLRAGWTNMTRGKHRRAGQCVSYLTQEESRIST